MRLFRRKWGNSLCHVSIAFELHLANSEEGKGASVGGAHEASATRSNRKPTLLRGGWERTPSGSLPNRLTRASKPSVENLEESRAEDGRRPPATPRGSRAFRGRGEDPTPAAKAVRRTRTCSRLLRARPGINARRASCARRHAKPVRRPPSGNAQPLSSARAERRPASAPPHALPCRSCGGGGGCRRQGNGAPTWVVHIGRGPFPPQVPGSPLGCSVVHSKEVLNQPEGSPSRPPGLPGRPREVLLAGAPPAGLAPRWEAPLRSCSRQRLGHHLGPRGRARVDTWTAPRARPQPGCCWHRTAPRRGARSLLGPPAWGPHGPSPVGHETGETGKSIRGLYGH